MRIDSLRLENYRNYQLAQVEFDSSVNVITGQNAQGKTNLLEAIAFLAQGRSFRTYKDAPLIRIGAQAAYITGNVYAQGRDLKIEARLFDQSLGRKQLLINGVKLKRSSDLSGRFCTVLFCPDDIMLFREGSQSRRRFLDDAISQLSPAYAAAAARYEALLKRKNRILKDQDEKPSLLDNLEDYNISMAKEGSLMIVTRAKYVARISQLAAGILEELSSGREQLELQYRTVSSVTDPLDRESVYIALREHQASHYRAELESRTCLSGPHKDDFESFINGLSIKTFGSQGQNRSGIVALKMAERELLKEDLGEYPVLLLDDVLSELDAGRQEFILSKIDKGQVFVTCCQGERLVSQTVGRGITIQGGRVCTSASAEKP